MLYKTLLILHISSAAIGWMAGFMAMMFRVSMLGMVPTAWIAAKRTTFGMQAVLSPRGLKDGYPPPLYFIFGSIAMLFAVSDFRLILRGGVSGVSVALLFATASFYPGQGRLFPKWLRATNLLYIPHVLLIGAMSFFLYRHSKRRRVVKPNFAAVTANLDGLAQGATR